MPFVKTAKTAGFCFGVSRAVETVYREAEDAKGPIYTFGPIIHNRLVVDDLKKKGVQILTEEMLSGRFPKTGCVVVRSHGVSEEIWKKLKATGMRVVDATCPFVRKIHRIVREASDAGRHVLIVGDAGHPEVIGIRGWVRGRCDVVASAEEVRRLSFSPGERLCTVSQTTFHHEKFQELVEMIGALGYDNRTVNTICSATKERQAEAALLAAEADVMLVIGSRESSNTQKLYEICRAGCVNTYYIQTIDDLIPLQFHSESLVGITAGASTPNNIIWEVSRYVGRT